MTKVSNHDLKKYLNNKTKQTLIEEILTLHKTDKKVQDYYSVKTNRNDNHHLFNQHKEALSDEFDTLNYPDITSINQSIYNFKSICDNKKLIVDLMIYAVERYLGYAKCVGRVDLEIFKETHEHYWKLMTYIYDNHLDDSYKNVCLDLALTGDNIHEYFDGTMIQVYMVYDQDFEWVTYLNNQLSFPFKGSISEAYEDNVFVVGDVIKVMGAESYDDLYGLILKVKRGREIFYLPSVELSIFETDSDQFKLLNLFEKWFLESSEEECMVDEIEFFKKIKNFENEISNFDYHPQLMWEYGEEVEEGDDAWMGVLEDLMETAIELFKCKHYTTAYKSFNSLVSIYTDEELTNSSEIDEYFNIGVADFYYKYLLSAYMYFDDKERASKLVEIVHQNHYILKFSLKTMLNSYNGTLPKLKDFTDDFIAIQRDFLDDSDDDTFMNDGKVEIYVDTLFYKYSAKEAKPYILTCVSKYPKAFYYYLLRLADTSTDQLIVETCLEALNIIPSSERVREDISKLMMQYAKKTDNDLLVSQSKFEAFLSNSSEENLIQLFEDLHSNKEDNIEKALIYLKEKPNQINILIKMYILLGAFDKVLELENNNKISDSKHLLIYLKLLTKNEPCQMIDLIYTEKSSYNTTIFSQYNNLLVDVIEQTDLSYTSKTALAEYCRQIIRSSVIGVVSNQHRYMYKQAAYEMTACFEMLKIIYDTETAYSFYNTLRQKYSKYSAFQRQLREGLKISQSTND
jgi:hypothetical protein